MTLPQPDRPARATLDRGTGRLTLAAPGVDAEAAYAVSLCKFLMCRGVPCVVVDDPPGVTAVQLRGVPDLEAVAGIVAEWEATVRLHPPDPPTRWQPGLPAGSAAG